MNKIAVLVYVVLALLTKILGLAFSVSLVLWHYHANKCA